MTNQPDTDTDTDGEEQGLAPIEAFKELADYSGQSYMLADGAWEYLQPFTKVVTDEFAAEFSREDEDIGDFDRAFALSKALAQAQRATEDTRGLLNTWPHEQVVTASDVSEILVQAIGEKPTDANYAGAGFTADAEHDGNIETLREALDLGEHLDDDE